MLSIRLFERFANLPSFTTVNLLQKNIFLPMVDLPRLCKIRLCHPPDGSTSPKYKLLCFITTKKICKEKNALAFNRDRCCHLVLCLRLILIHSKFTTVKTGKCIKKSNNTTNLIIKTLYCKR